MSELKWLEDLLVLIEERSFTKAAQRRNVTQPAFSRRIRLLEEWIGSPIVNRQRKPVALRDSVLKRSADIRQLVISFYQLRNEIRETNLAQDKTVFVVQHSLATSLFPKLLQQLRQHAPNSSYRIKTMNNDECLDNFLQAGHFMLCYESDYMHSLRLHDSIFRLKLGSDRMVPVMCNQLAGTLFPEDSQDAVKQALPLLLYPEDQYMGAEIRRTVLPETMQQFATEVVCESAFSVTLREMVRSGMGLAWLPEQLVLNDIESGTLESPVNKLGVCPLSISLYCKYDNATSELFDWFRENRV